MDLSFDDIEMNSLTRGMFENGSAKLDAKEQTMTMKRILV
jgi:hypothetical protein